MLTSFQSLKTCIRVCIWGLLGIVLIVLPQTLKAETRSDLSGFTPVKTTTCPGFSWFHLVKTTTYPGFSWFHLVSQPDSFNLAPSPLAPSSPPKPNLRYQTLREAVHHMLRLQQRYQSLKEQHASSAQLQKILDDIQEIEQLYSTTFAATIRQTKIAEKRTRQRVSQQAKPYKARVSSSSSASSLPELDMSKPVKVRGYYRKDGTYVRPHTRSLPKR